MTKIFNPYLTQGGIEKSETSKRIYKTSTNTSHVVCHLSTLETETMSFLQTF